MTLTEYPLFGAEKLRELPRDLAEELAIVNSVVARAFALSSKSEASGTLRQSTVSKAILHDAPLKKKMQANFTVM